MTIADRLSQARQLLVKALDLPLNEAAIEAHLLMRHALGGVSRAWMITHEDQVLAMQQSDHLKALLQRRLEGEPIAYILGHREFYGLDFSVTPDVLIPRSDTETLVEAALERIPEHASYRVLDLGTGSGAIAIAIAKHRTQAAVTAADYSAAALAVAEKNAKQLAASNVRCLQSDWFSTLKNEIFDVIVSNPPYIAAADPHLRQGDLRFEPSNALASGDDGLDDIRRILAQAPAHLVSGGWLLLEHGYDQAEQVAKLLRKASFDGVDHAIDIAGIQRVTLGRKL